MKGDTRGGRDTVRDGAHEGPCMDIPYMTLVCQHLDFILFRPYLFGYVDLCCFKH